MVSPSAQPLRFALITALGMWGTVMAIAVSSPMPKQGFSTREEGLESDYELMEAPEEAFVREFAARPGKTLASTFTEQAVQDPPLLKYLASTALGTQFSRQNKVERWLLLTTNRAGEVRSVLMPIPATQRGLFVQREAASRFSVRDTSIPVERTHTVVSIPIRSTWQAALASAAVPNDIVSSLADVFAKRIQVQSALHKGDRVTLIYETIQYNGLPIDSGKLLAAELVVGRKHVTALRFAPSGGNETFYTPEGQTLNRTVVRPPVDVSRITSTFVPARNHPLFHDIRHHTGIDYAAPLGTEVHATDTGVVEFVGVQKGYGNILILRHDRAVSTVYGHLNGFAEGLKKGSRVQQGQVIGFVGQTGWATGPHLHYEYRINNVFQDPNQLSGRQAALAGKPLAAFRSQTASLLTQLSLGVPSDKALND